MHGRNCLVCFSARPETRFTRKAFSGSSPRRLTCRKPHLEHRTFKTATRPVRCVAGLTQNTHLSELRVRNFALIDEQCVHFHPGLNIITGQSGSGKSVMLDAISQLCGAPAREESIRTGEECAVIEGTFRVGGDKITQVSAVLAKYGLLLPAVFSSSEHKDFHTSRSVGYEGDDTRVMNCENTSSGTMVVLHVERQLVFLSSSFTKDVSSPSLQVPKRLRSVCRVNGTNVPLKALRELSGTLVDFNGQGSASDIAGEDAQLQLLDSLGGTSGLRTEFERSAAELSAFRTELVSLVDISAGERDELNLLIDTVQSVSPFAGEDLRLKAELRSMENARLTAVMCGELIDVLEGKGNNRTADAGGGVRSTLSDAVVRIKSLQSAVRRTGSSASTDVAQDELKDPAEDDRDETERRSNLDDGNVAAIAGLEEALRNCHEADVLVREAQARIEEYVTFLQADHLRQEECTSRLKELQRLCRSIGVSNVEQACAAAEAARSRIESADNSRERRAALVEMVERTEGDLAKIGLALGSARRDAASALRRDMTTALASLAMDGTRFDVSLSWEKLPVESSNDPWVSSGVYVAEAAQEVGEENCARYRLRNGGLDCVTFLLAPGPTEHLRPMSSIASGGETARLFLAMKLAPAIRMEQRNVEKVCIANSVGRVYDSNTAEGSSTLEDIHCKTSTHAATHAATSVFDELDSGVGARVGEKIGAALRRLATSGEQQVICVTHLPQVAAFGDKHFQIRKDISKYSGTAETIDDVHRITIVVEELVNEEARITEISNMLGLGETEGRESAARMLEANVENI